MRIGHGYDAHRFIEGRPLILGGVEIPYEKGLAAHSDGDAVIHALCDALLGAAALGDIGSYFPDTDADFENIDSRILLRKVMQLIADKGFTPANVDITILAQQPKMAPHITPMRYVISRDMGIDVDRVSIKATTTEKMGFIGREEGIAVHAVALLQ
jgi:2-C-methyl-D-erythritol 2,4-cyclodiphosphate synthase